MATTTPSISFSLLTLLLISSLSSPSTARVPTDPVPSLWPPQFHAVLFMNNSGTLQKTDLWYDWPNGRNFNIIQKQLGTLTYDLEWNNGTSFIYTLDSEKKCRVLHFEVGILRPNWLDGANYLGQKYIDGFLCNVWEKVDFIWYYEDVNTKRPVYWEFYTGFRGHVMTFEVGKVLEDVKWQAPVYCFKEAEEEEVNCSSMIESMAGLTLAPSGSLMREREREKVGLLHLHLRPLITSDYIFLPITALGLVCSLAGILRESWRFCNQARESK